MTSPFPRWSSPETWPKWLAPGLLVLLIAAIYGQTLTHGFFNFDDPVYITDNPQVLRGLNAQGFFWAWTTCLTGMWSPLTWLSLMVNVSLFGQGAEGFHAVNLLLHAACAVLLYTLLKEATEAAGRSLFVAALFAVHPINVETVAWASQRKSTLSTLFCLITLYAWVLYVRKGYKRAYAAALLSFVLGLLTKPMLVTLPVLMLLLECWPLQPRACGWKRRALELLPFCALSAISGWICLFPFGPTDVAIEGSRLISRDIMNVPLNIVSYLGKLTYPIDLAVFYPLRSDWSLLSFCLCTVGLLAATLFIIMRKNRLWMLGGGWFAITLLPVCGIISFGRHCMADRYLYLPAIGLFIALAWSLPVRRAYVLLAGLLLAGFGALAFAQVNLWQSPTLVWLQASRSTEDNPVTQLNLGSAFLEQGRMEESMHCMQRVLAMNPREARAWMNLGYMNDKTGHKREALACLRQAAQFAPGDARVHNHLGSLLQDLGQLGEAETELKEALRLRPDYVDPWINLGVLRASTGDLPAAIGAFEQALAIQPNSPAAKTNLALARAQLAAKGR